MKAMLGAATQELAGGNKRSFRIIPAGKFKAVDGRPDVGWWNLTESNGRAIAAAAAARQSDIVIDFDHATLTAPQTGKPAPAAGWFKAMEWRPDGLYVKDARWTANAARMIDAKEYRYISPVITYREDGTVTGLLNAAICNCPGIDGLTDLSAATLTASVKVAVATKPLDQRIAEGAGNTGMTDRQVREMVALCGYTPAELAQLQSEQGTITAQLTRDFAAEASACGMTLQELEYFKRSFGCTPSELRQLTR